MLMLVHVPPQLLAVLGIAAIAAIAVGTYALYERHHARTRRDPTKR